MAKLSPVILPLKKLKDNSHKIRIALAHNGETKYIVTDIIVSSDTHFKNGKIVREKNADFLNVKLRKIIMHYQELIEATDYINSMTCGELMCILKNGSPRKRMTIDEVFNEYIATANLKPNTKMNHSKSWNTILKSMGGDLFLDNITSHTLAQTLKNLKNRGLSNTTQWGYLGILRTITNHAVKNEYVVFKKDPWLNLKKPQKQVRECWLELETLKKFRDMEFSSRHFNHWRNVFMLSFYLGGINLIDLVQLDFKKILETGKINYVRQKSNGSSRNSVRVEYDVPEEATAAIQELISDKCFKRFRKENIRSVLTNAARFYKRMRKDIGNDSLIYYSARKTFSQIAFELGINSYVIDYILGHSIHNSKTTLYHYVYVTPQMATDAIRKVLDYIK